MTNKLKDVNWDIVLLVSYLVATLATATFAWSNVVGLAFILVHLNVRRFLEIKTATAAAGDKSRLERLEKEVQSLVSAAEVQKLTRR